MILGKRSQDIEGAYDTYVVCDMCRDEHLLFDINEDIPMMVDDGWKVIESIDCHYCKDCVVDMKRWEREHNSGKLVSNTGALV